MRHSPRHWSFIRLSLLCCIEPRSTATASDAGHDCPPPLPLPGTPLLQKILVNVIQPPESFALGSAHRVPQQPPTRRRAIPPFEDPCDKQAQWG